MVRLPLIIAFVTSLLVCTSAQARKLEDVSLKLQWLHQFQFAGYYVAKEKGFYKDAGLRVTIVPFESGSQDVVNLVKTGQVHYGTGRASLVVDKLMGKPVVALAAIFQKSPSVLISLADNNITRVRDLIGRKVMVTSDALLAADIVGMLEANKVLPHDIYRQNHSYNLEDLITKKTDAMACYVSNEPYTLRERGIPFVAFHPSDYGQDYYGDMLFTSQREVRHHPERARAFRQASLKGWAYAFANIEETARLIKQKYNKQNKSIESLIFEGEALKKLAYIDDISLGHIDPDKIERIAKFYHDLGAVNRLDKLSALIFPKQ